MCLLGEEPCRTRAYLGQQLVGWFCLLVNDGGEEEVGSPGNTDHCSFSLRCLHWARNRESGGFRRVMMEKISAQHGRCVNT